MENNTQNEQIEHFPDREPGQAEFQNDENQNQTSENQLNENEESEAQNNDLVFTDGMQLAPE